MNKKILLKFFIILLLVFNVLSVTPVLAEINGTTGVQESLNKLGKVGGDTGLDKSGGGDLPTIVGGIVGAVLGVLGAVLLLMIVYAGFLWMTAQGKDDQIKKAKQMIFNAIIGIIIVASAWAITSFVLNQLQKISSGKTATQTKK